MSQSSNSSHKPILLNPVLILDQDLLVPPDIFRMGKHILPPCFIIPRDRESMLNRKLLEQLLLHLNSFIKSRKGLMDIRELLERVHWCAQRIQAELERILNESTTDYSLTFAQPKKAHGIVLVGVQKVQSSRLKILVLR